MAYMNQEKKKLLAPGIKEVLKKHGVKGTIGVRDHSTLVVTITEGNIDFGTTQKDVNHYHIEHFFEGYPKAISFLTELKSAMMVGNHDRSDSQSDYFDVGWYIDIDIGRWNKPYVLHSEN